MDCKYSSGLYFGNFVPGYLFTDGTRKHGFPGAKRSRDALIVDGQFTFTGVIIASTLGSIVGSLVSYAMGFYGGKPFIKRFGKFLLLDVHDLELTEKFFAKRGELTIFIARFVPVIRHLISIPAGLGKMKLGKFIIYTTLGAGLWNSFLAYVGFKLKENWAEVMKYSHTIDIVVVAILGFAFLYYAYKIYLNLTKKPSAS
jgi:membrane protein DedA with SNARE-associated domain